VQGRKAFRGKSFLNATIAGGQGGQSAARHL
jgi:hypothetical protein